MLHLRLATAGLDVVPIRLLYLSKDEVVAPKLECAHECAITSGNLCDLYVTAFISMSQKIVGPKNAPSSNPKWGTFFHPLIGLAAYIATKVVNANERLSKKRGKIVIMSLSRMALICPVR